MITVKFWDIHIKELVVEVERKYFRPISRSKKGDILLKLSLCIEVEVFYFGIQVLYAYENIWNYLLNFFDNWIISLRTYLTIFRQGIFIIKSIISKKNISTCFVLYDQDKHLKSKLIIDSSLYLDIRKFFRWFEDYIHNLKSNNLNWIENF